MNPDERVTYFAETDARGKRVRFGIKSKDRSRHTYVIGKTGMGKSTLLENMAIQDIQNGEGLTFIDPHGSTAEKLLDYVPEERIKDVLYFAPFDLDYPVSFNVLEQVEADKRHLVVSGLMATFEKIWVDAWSARMAYILQNTLLALLQYPDATLLGVNRMYSDKDYRKRVVEHLTDPTSRSFWVDEYAKYTDKYAAEATPAIQNKIGQFASNPLIRNIIGQPRSSFNIRDLMDKKKIFIVNLSKGRVGEGNANLLGSMLITKIYLAAMSRADSMGAVLKALPHSYLYVDEFQSFANKSFADILSEARKYKLNLTIAHQYIEQMEEEVRAAVFGNVGTMIAFRVGSYDAETLEKEFAPIFTMEDIVNLGFAQVYMKLMIDGVSSQPFSATTLGPIPEPSISNRDRIIASSRALYAERREDTEAAITKWHEPIITIGAAPARPPARADEPRPTERPPMRSGTSTGSSAAPRTSTSTAYPPREQAPREAAPRTEAPPVRRENPPERRDPPAAPSAVHTTQSLRDVLSKLSNAEKAKQAPPEKSASPAPKEEVKTEVRVERKTEVTTSIKREHATTNRPDQKSPTSSDRDSLKDALRAFTEKKQNPIETPKIEREAVKEPESQRREHRETEKVPREIPEAELRAMLAVEEPPR